MSNSLSKIRDTSSKILRKVGWIISLALLVLTLASGWQIYSIQQEQDKNNEILLDLAKKHVEIPKGNEIDHVFCDFIKDLPSECGVYLKGESSPYSYFQVRNRGNSNLQFVP